MLRKVTVGFFGVVWAVLAWFLMPGDIFEPAPLSIDEWYRVFASVVTLVVGVASSILSWRG
jgi:hypothetical protein